MAGFDVKAARDAGYTDDEILHHLSTTRPSFDIEGAVKGGYSTQEIIDHLAGGQAVAPPSQYNPVQRGDKLKGTPTGFPDSFMGTLANDFASIPENALAAIRHPYDYAKGAYDNFINVPEATGDLYAQGKYGKMGARAVESILPFVGEAGGVFGPRTPRPASSSTGPTLRQRLTSPEVVSAATDFIPYIGPSTGLKAKTIKLGKAIMNAKPAPGLPVPPYELDPYSFPSPRDRWDASGPAYTPPAEAAPGLVDPAYRGSGAGMEYDAPAKAGQRSAPRPKAPPKPKPLTKQEREVAARSLDPYAYPPGSEPASGGFPQPPETTPLDLSGRAPRFGSEGMEYGGPEPPPAPPPKPQKPKAPTKEERGAAARSLDPYQYPPGRDVSGLPQPPVLPPPPQPVDMTYRSSGAPMDWEAQPPKAMTAPPAAATGPAPVEAPATPPKPTITPEQQAVVDRVMKENAKKAAEADKGIVVQHDQTMPQRYKDMVPAHGTVGAEAAWKKDLKVAQRLRDQEVTPEQWLKMDLDTQNGHLKAAGFKALGKGGSRARTVVDGINHIHQMLTELYAK